MFLTKDSLHISDVLVLSDEYSFKKNYFEKFFKEYSYDLIFTNDSQDISKYKKVYYIGPLAISNHNKRNMFLREEKEIIIPYFPKRFEDLEKLFSSFVDGNILSTVKLTELTKILSKESFRLVSLYLEQNGDGFIYSIYLPDKFTISHGSIPISELTNLLLLIEKSIIITFSANILKRMLSNKGIYLKNKTYDLQVMKHVLNDDSLVSGDKRYFSQLIYKEYELLDTEIIEKNQDNFLKYQNKLKDLLTFLEIKGLRIDTQKESKFVSNNKKYIFNNKVHPNFNNLTFSGRVYANNPSITNISREEKCIFLPNNEQNVIYSIDFNQLELRVLYSLLDNKDFIDSCNSGIDFHSKTASLVLNKDISEITEQDRQEGKKYNFLILYSGLENNNKISDQFSDILIKRKTLIDIFKNNKKVVNPYGRVLEITDEDDKQIFNFYIQSTASDLVFTFLLTLLNKISIDNSDIMLYNIIHDELLFELPKSKIIILDSLIEESLEETKTTNTWLKTALTISRKEY